MLPRLTPRVRASYICRATVIFSGVILRGRPPLRPRARRAAIAVSPAAVHSRSRSRSKFREGRE